MTFKIERVLIWGKTYPELSKRYVETVCTGGVREDGSPIRLYPVPLRYLENNAQYRLYDWIDVPVEKSRTDARPESFKVSAERIQCISHVGTESGTWKTRRELIFKDLDWHFASVGALKAAHVRCRRSIGLVTPGKIEAVRLELKSEEKRIEYEQKMIEIQNQRDLFRPEYRELTFLSQNIILEWRCQDRCAECNREPHRMKALDWGLLELARRESWEAARSKLEEISNLATHDFRVFMGNFAQHPQNFGIIGLWYPLRKYMRHTADSKQASFL